MGHMEEWKWGVEVDSNMKQNDHHEIWRNKKFYLKKDFIKGEVKRDGKDGNVDGI